MNKFQKFGGEKLGGIGPPPPDRNAVGALHSAMRHLSDAGSPIVEAHKATSAVLDYLDKLGPDAAEGSVLAIEEALSAIDDLHYNYAKIYGALHRAGALLYEKRAADMEGDPDADADEQ